jgi:hypothetical protein
MYHVTRWTNSLLQVMPRFLKTTFWLSGYYISFFVVQKLLCGGENGQPIKCCKDIQTSYKNNNKTF